MFFRLSFWPFGPVAATCCLCACTVICGAKKFRSITEFPKFENDGIMLGKFNGPGTLGLFANGEKSGLANGLEKKDGTLVGTVIGELRAVPKADTCADAGPTPAKNRIIPKNNMRLRIAHLPRFVILSIERFEEPGK